MEGPGKQGLLQTCLTSKQLAASESKGFGQQFRSPVASQESMVALVPWPSHMANPEKVISHVGCGRVQSLVIMKP